MFLLWHICHVLWSLGRRTATFMFVSWTWTHVRVMCIPPLHILLSCFILALARPQECTFQPKTLPRGSPRTFSRPDMTGASRSGCPGQMERLDRSCRSCAVRHQVKGSGFNVWLPSSRPRSGAKIAWRGSRIVEPKGFSFGTSGNWLEIKRNQCLKAKYLHYLLAAMTIILPLWYPLMPFCWAFFFRPPRLQSSLIHRSCSRKTLRLGSADEEPATEASGGAAVETMESFGEPETTGVGFSYSLPFCNQTWQAGNPL